MNKNETAALLATFAQLRKKDRVFVMALAQGLKDKAAERARSNSTRMLSVGGTQ